MEKIKNTQSSESPPNPGREKQASLGSRLRKIWHASGLLQKDFAAQMHISAATLIHYLNDRRIPRADFIELLCEKHDISPKWLLYGEGPVKRGRTDKITPPQSGHGPKSVRDPAADYGAYPRLDMVAVPRVRARLSPDTGELEPDPGRSPYVFAREWLSTMGDPDRMALMDVYGEQDLDTVLIDTDQNEVTTGRFYAVSFNDLVVVKMIDAAPGMLVFKNKNKDTDPIIDELNDHTPKVRVLGRVVWWCGKER
ncbi:MAG: helix-turn-helix domain-containing protein [Thermodesulfobacteriota bacterium]|nr:helix-turn-helix domain-containing protein [Thermodesulfobacteriota bacterium]